MRWGRGAMLLAGGALLAGALFASATTRSIPEGYRHATKPAAGSVVEDFADPAPEPDAAYGAPDSSWIERGLALIDRPAWPFGREQWEGPDPGFDGDRWDGESADALPPGYAPYLAERDRYPAFGEDEWDEPPPPRDRITRDSGTVENRSARSEVLASDPAAQAAADAEAAARDVTAAERAR